MKTFLQVFQDTEALNKRAADIFTTAANEAIQNRGRFLLALSGGKTPSGLYKLLAQKQYQENLDWQKSYVFWGDERCVEPDDMESNYRQAKELFLRYVSIPDDHILRIEGERGAVEASNSYRQTLKEFGTPPYRWPSFDLVLLGMGEDGHIASLFPNSDVRENIPVLPITAKYKGRPSERVTLTEAVFNSAHHIIFLVTGSRKAKILQRVLSSDSQLKDFPAQRIQPTNGKVSWLVDKEAASELPDGGNIY